MSRNRLERLSEPSPYPVGSWRWLLLKPVVPVHWDGRGTLPEGVAHGDIAHYHRLSRRHAFAVSHRRLWALWRRLTVVRRPCGCSHRWLYEQGVERAKRRAAAVRALRKDRGDSQ